MHTRAIRILGAAALIMSFAGAALATDGVDRVDDNPSVSDQVGSVAPATPSTIDAAVDASTTAMTVADLDDATTTVTSVDDPDDATRTAGDVSGSCDEVEHVDDIACADVTVDDDADDVASATGDVGGPCDAIEDADDPRRAGVSDDDTATGFDHQGPNHETVQAAYAGRRHRSGADDESAVGTSGSRGGDD